MRDSSEAIVSKGDGNEERLPLKATSRETMLNIASALPLYSTFFVTVLFGTPSIAAIPFTILEWPLHTLPMYMLRIWITWKQIDLIGPSLTQKENLLRFMSTDDLVCSRASSYKCFIFPYRSPSIINQVLGNLSAECILNLFVLWTIIWILTNRPDLKSASSGHARMVPRTHKTRWWGALAKFWYQKQITRLPNVFMKSISQHFIAKVLLLQVLCAPLKIRKLLVVYQEILWNLTLDIHKSAFFYFFLPPAAGLCFYFSVNRIQSFTRRRKSSFFRDQRTLPSDWCMHQMIR